MRPWRPPPASTRPDSRLPCRGRPARSRRSPTRSWSTIALPSYDARVRLVDSLIARSLPAVPRPLVRRFADRYIAGEATADAVNSVRALNGRRLMATLAVLGEFVEDGGQADETLQRYLELLSAVFEERLDANVSVKPSALGLLIDPPGARQRTRQLVESAARLGTFVRIDMEDSQLTDATLELYRGLRQEGHENVGIVLQSRLKRSLADIDALARLAPNVRLVKGIYIEPAEIAHSDPALINRALLRMLERLLDGGSYVAVASHDEAVLAGAQALLRERAVPPDRYEFQTLLGVRDELRDRLLAAGHRVRVYVPFGEQWYEYSLRRLQENPSLAGYVATDAVRSLVGR